MTKATLLERLEASEHYASLIIGKLRVTVRIIDYKDIMGRQEAKVSPARGSGETWVTIKRLELEKS